MFCNVLPGGRFCYKNKKWCTRYERNRRFAWPTFVASFTINRSIFSAQFNMTERSKTCAFISTVSLAIACGVHRRSSRYLSYCQIERQTPSRAIYFAVHFSIIFFSSHLTAVETVKFQWNSQNTQINFTFTGINGEIEIIINLMSNACKLPAAVSYINCTMMTQSHA